MPQDRIDLKQGPPPVPMTLVEWLEAVWPDRFPDLAGADASALHRQAGRIEVIRCLREHALRQGQSGSQRSPRQPTRTESPF